MERVLFFGYWGLEDRNPHSSLFWQSHSAVTSVFGVFQKGTLPDACLCVWLVVQPVDFAIKSVLLRWRSQQAKRLHAILLTETCLASFSGESRRCLTVMEEKEERFKRAIWPPRALSIPFISRYRVSHLRLQGPCRPGNGSPITLRGLLCGHVPPRSLQRRWS